MAEVLHRIVVETPLGPLTAVATASGLCALEFPRPQRQRRLEARLGRWFAPYEIVDEASGLLQTTRDWLDAYFEGNVTQVGPAPLDLRGTPFERQVWSCLLQVPAGTTFTYGGIAERLARRRAARAVGVAVGANPVSIIVPCHRIVGHDGALTGYGGGLERKRWLLDHELRWFDKTPGRLF